jgi:hypothetical protein
VPLYYAKIFRKSIQMKWLYRRVRHPQYLALAISGFGLLFYWPRFIILFFYISMLFVYYILARNEEWRMTSKFGRSYEEYMERTPMFLPGEPGGKLFGLLFGRIRPKWAGLLVLYLLCVAGSIVAAMGIRSYTEGRIQKYRAGGIVAVPVFPRAERDLAAVIQRALSDTRVKEALPPDANLAYVMPCDFFLMAVVTDEPRRFSPDVVNYPETVEWSRRKFYGGIGTFLKIYYYYTKTVWGGQRDEPEAERIVFARASRRGTAVPPGAALGIGLEREPLLLVDMDARTREIFFVKELSGLHKWGRAPMPAF